ncbi:MAG: PH domain-containing protein [Pseudonocardia sp.]
MTFPDDALAAGEHVAVHVRPHPKMLIGAVVWFVLVVGVAIYLAGLIGDPTWSLVLAGVALALVAWLTVVPLIRWRTTHVVVTDRRVIVREGILTREGVDLPLRRVDSVRYSQSLLDRLFGCGTLAIESVSGEALEFEDIPDVASVYAVLRAGTVGAQE